jgi:hypothetical protein
VSYEGLFIFHAVFLGGGGGIPASVSGMVVTVLGSSGVGLAGAWWVGSLD